MKTSSAAGAPARQASVRTSTWSRGGRRIVAALTAGALLGVAGAGAAQADDLYNTIAGTALNTVINDKVEVMSLVEGGPSKETGLRIQARNSSIDGFEGCNTPKGTTVTFAFESSNPLVAAVDTPTLTFSACTAPALGTLEEQVLRVRPVSAGTATITATVVPGTGKGSYRLDTATVRADVAPPANSAPTVRVTGVTEGQEFRKGIDVATPMCEATDAEDGTTTFTPAMSRGEDADELSGLGLRIATCRYTDSRGDAAVPDVVRYSIIDGTSPVVTPKLSKVAPASGWYRSEVALEWIVRDPESEATLSTEGCDRVWINTDQAGTTHTCTATSKGGTTTVESPSISYDATPPTVTGTIDEGATPAIDVDGVTWYATHPEISWSATDEGSGVASEPTETVPFAAPEGQNMMVRRVATDNAGNTGGTSLKGINVDVSAPVVTAELTSTPDHVAGETAWFKEKAIVTVSATDPEVQPSEEGSGVAGDATVEHEVTTTGDFTATVQDRVGNAGTSNAVRVDIDDTAPVVTATCPTAPIKKGLVRKASWTASDAGSGLAGAASGSVNLDTSKVGNRTFTAPVATDNVGNTSEPTATCGYRVVYAFVGFLAPVDNYGTYNKVKAGSAVPLKFSLMGSHGTGILKGAPVATSVKCPATMKTDTLEETAPASSVSGLKYDSKKNLYTYTWKTATTLAGTCQRLTVNLVDGNSYSALFTFTK